MVYSHHTPHSSPPPGVPVRPVWVRFSAELGLGIGAVLLVLWWLALLSYSPTDAAWSTSGDGSDLQNRADWLGARLADVSYFVFGYSIWWCVAAAVRAWRSGLSGLLRSHDWLPDRRAKERRPAAVRVFRQAVFGLGLLLLMCCSTVLEWHHFSSLEVRLPGYSGGVVGYWLGPLWVRWLGPDGSSMVAIALGVVGIGTVFNFSWGQVAENLGAWLCNTVNIMRKQLEKDIDQSIGQQAAMARAEDLLEDRQDMADHPHPHPILIEPILVDMPKVSRLVKVKERQQPLFKDDSAPTLPQVDLLDAVVSRLETVTAETLEMTSRMIEKKLKDFGVLVTVVLAQPGPVITRYEIEPATGVKGSQIVGLAKDLARSLCLISIRVVETIPGKKYMALELPNAKRQTIKLSEILGSDIYTEAQSLLTMGLGKDIIGSPVVADLAKMPHVLVAGTTGSGKSVGINAMILSLLFKAPAQDVRLLMIDPKMLEMSIYEGIPHLLCPVVTDMKQAANGLAWCVAEMERRYKLMSNQGVRNLAGFNQKIDEATARGIIIGNPFSLTPDDPEPLGRLPHIVVVIDELADLMMVIGKKIEELIARLAQKARAAGIHLILATQRPSVDVITGLIKANIPTRIAFQVSSKIDSRTILDQMGAEALLGMGDMLYMPSGTGQPIRVHGAFVSDNEVHRVVTYLKSQGAPNYIEGILEGHAATDGDDSGADIRGDGSMGDAEKDPLYDQAVEVVLKSRKSSISWVQRQLKIGYNRSARLVEQMEHAGLVGKLGSNGVRDILVPPTQSE